MLSANGRKASGAGRRGGREGLDQQSGVQHEERRATSKDIGVLGRRARSLVRSEGGDRSRTSKVDVRGLRWARVRNRVNHFAGDLRWIRMMAGMMVPVMRLRPRLGQGTGVGGQLTHVPEDEEQDQRGEKPSRFE